MEVKTRPNSFRELNWRTTQQNREAPFYVLHCDGAAWGNPGPAGAGAILESPNGQTYPAYKYLGNATSNEAEYWGLLIGLELAKAQKARKIKVCMDSELIIKQLRGEYRVRADNLRPLWNRAKGLLQRFVAYELHHNPRGQNQEADRLANLAITEGLRGKGQAA